MTERDETNTVGLTILSTDPDEIVSIRGKKARERYEQNARDIVVLVASGKITAQEGKERMVTLSKERKHEIERIYAGTRADESSRMRGDETNES